MNKVKQIIFGTLFFVSFFAAANNGELVNKEVCSKVRKAVIMPESFKSKSSTHKVSVRFAVNEAGQVAEVCVITNDKDAKRDLEQQFFQMNFKELEPCVRHSIDITFVFL
jgi:hypothetical protein